MQRGRDSGQLVFVWFGEEKVLTTPLWSTVPFSIFLSALFPHVLFSSTVGFGLEGACLPLPFLIYFSLYILCSLFFLFSSLQTHHLQPIVQLRPIHTQKANLLKDSKHFFFFFFIKWLEWLNCASFVSRLQHEQHTIIWLWYNVGEVEVTNCQQNK